MVSRKLIGAIFLGTLSLLALGCKSLIGKGAIPSISGKGVATFEFDFNCDVETNAVSGSLTYLDEGSSVSFTATAESSPFDCQKKGRGAIFTGVYSPAQDGDTSDKSDGSDGSDGSKGGGSSGEDGSSLTDGKNRGRGRLVVVVSDAKNDKKDAIGVLLLGGTYDGYANFGTLSHGRIEGAASD